MASDEGKRVDVTTDQRRAPTGSQSRIRDAGLDFIQLKNASPDGRQSAGRGSGAVQKAPLSSDRIELTGLDEIQSADELRSKDIRRIVGMARADDGKLYTVLQFSNGTMGLVANWMLNDVRPQLVISFYEAHLKWS